MGNVKDKIITLSKIDLTKDYNKPTRVNNVYKGGKKRRKLKLKNNHSVIKDVRNLFRLMKKMDNFFV